MLTHPLKCDKSTYACKYCMRRRLNSFAKQISQIPLINVARRGHTNRVEKKNGNANKQENTPYPAFEAGYGVLFH